MAVAACLTLAAGTPNVLLASPSAAPDSTRAPGAASGAGAAAPDSARPAASPPPEPAYVAVETRPSGLRVTIGAIEVGWSPLAPTRVVSGRVTVRAFPPDSRRFDPAIDGVMIDAAPGETIRVFLDLRPHPLLRSKPAASVSLLALRPEEPDSAVGETPLRLAPAILESRRVRFEAAGFADSVVAGAWILEASAGGAASANVTLRS
ncbi:MAG TPA: hypothetical protein VI198_00050, partial [Candidatus Eisenbacteria bacterium]